MAEHGEEAALVRRCVAGDREAWRFLITQYGALVAHAVRTTLQRVLQTDDPNKVDDAIQAIWLSLCDDGCRRLRGFQSRCALSTWLTVLSTRRTIDYIRTEMRKGSLKNLHLDGEERDLVKELRSPDEEERLLPDEIFLLYDALDSLPPDDKLILKMYYLDGLSYRSIASALRMSPNTISSTILRAREKLRRRIKGEMGGVQ